MTKWILGGLALVLVATGLYVQSQNQTNAKRQVAAIVAADAAGQDTAAARQALSSFVTGHTALSASFKLDGSYQRAQAAAEAAAAAQATNSQIYAAAQAACSGHSDSITQAKCNQDYLAKHLVNLPAPTPVAKPNAADYSFAYHGAFWTPDLPGALYLGATAALALAVILSLRRRGRRL